MKRSFDPSELELMDRPQPVSAELERDLENIRDLNRWFGSYALIAMFLSRWIKPGAELRIVDLATGSADIPRFIAEYGRKVGAELRIDALDRQSSTLEIAKKLSVRYPGINFVEGNMLEWNAPQPYDLVLCTLALHHFSEDDAVRVLQRCLELSRKFVLVSDLRRGWLATLGVRFLTATMFREPMTKYDARLSVVRAFTFSEMNLLAQRAGWKNFRQKTFPFARQAIWLG
ncbi:MAG TPA: methyltransferase domain-containing protein [Chthoniobacterales bacterium]|jgi:2-polyprenyl-3-methyl-5-hydroxy-6-metoxy-1,4-benzoquinol methylase|nr:methyltransferase domain-containing protein [Chthoniobacterales bacterium]